MNERYAEEYAGKVREILKERGAATKAKLATLRSAQALLDKLPVAKVPSGKVSLAVALSPKGPKYNDPDANYLLIGQDHLKVWLAGGKHMSEPGGVVPKMVYPVGIPKWLFNVRGSYDRAVKACAAGQPDPPCGKELSPLSVGAKSLEPIRYLLVVRGRETAPKIDLKKKVFEAGFFDGDLHIFDFATGKHLGGFPVRSGNKRALKYRYSDDQRGAALTKLRADLADETQRCVRKQLRAHVSPRPKLKLYLPDAERPAVTVAPKGGGFQAKMYHKPTVTHRKVAIAGGGTMPLTMYSDTYRQFTAFTIGHGTGRNVSVSPKDQVKVLSDGVIKSFNVKRPKTAGMRIGRHPGNAISGHTTIDGRLYAIEGRVYVIDSDIYQLTAMVTPGLEADAKRLLDSFKLKRRSKPRVVPKKKPAITRPSAPKLAQVSPRGSGVTFLAPAIKPVYRAPKPDGISSSYVWKTKPLLVQLLEFRFKPGSRKGAELLGWYTQLTRKPAPGITFSPVKSITRGGLTGVMYTRKDKQLTTTVIAFIQGLHVAVLWVTPTWPSIAPAAARVAASYRPVAAP